MIKYVAEKTWGTLKFQVNGFNIDLSNKWPRIKYADLLREEFGIDVFNPDRAKITEILRAHSVEVTAAQNHFPPH